MVGGDFQSLGPDRLQTRSRSWLRCRPRHVSVPPEKSEFLSCCIAHAHHPSTRYRLGRADAAAPPADRPVTAPGVAGAVPAAAKGNQMPALIKRSFLSIDTDTLPILYKTLVRPHLEYDNLIWGP